MTESYTNPKNDRRSLTHTGTEVGSSNITLSQNTPNREDEVLAWKCPRKFDSIVFSAGDHVTKFLPRYRESFDGDGSTSTFNITGDIAPPNGENYIPNMSYQPVVAYDSDAGSQLTVDSYDFDAGTVTFASAPNTGTGNVVVWPIMLDGVLKYFGVDQFDNPVAALDRWGIPLHVFNDFDTDQNMTQIHLTGAATWEEEEELVLRIEAPQQIVWQDGEFPNGEYASQIEQRVDVNV